MAINCRRIPLDQVTELTLSGVDKKVKSHEHEVLLCNYMDVYSNRFIRSDFRFMEATATEHEIQRCTLRSGDVVITKDSEQYDDIGVPALVRDNVNNLICGYHLAILRPLQELIDGAYLFYALQTTNAQHQFHAYANGTTRFGLRKDDIRRVEIPLPPLPKQRTIAHILGTLDNKIELNRCMNETLEGMARALFKSWFIDFDPVRAKMEGRWRRGKSLPGLPADLWGFFPDRLVDSNMGEIPKGWEIIPFPEAIDFKEGPGIRNWQYTNSKEGTHFINIRCIQNGDIILNNANRIRDEEANGKYAHFHLKEWDIVISSSGTLGRSAVVRREHLPLVLNTSVIRFRPIKGKMLFSYLNGYLNSFIFLDELKSMASGSVQRNFGPTHLKEMCVLCPKYDCLKQYDRLAGFLLKNSIKKRAENDNLSALRDILLPKLISGEMRVNMSEHSYLKQSLNITSED